MKTLEVDDYVYETIKYHAQGLIPMMGGEKEAIAWEVEFMLNHHLVELFVLLVDSAFEGVIRRMKFEQLAKFANAYMYALHSHDENAVVVRNSRDKVVGVTTATGNMDLRTAQKKIDMFDAEE